MQLPLGRLPEHIGNLRSILLERLGLPKTDEDATISNVKEIISRRLPAIFNIDERPKTCSRSLPSDLSWAVKADISQWLRHGVAKHVRDFAW